jgi:hypothetical protein
MVRRLAWQRLGKVVIPVRKPVRQRSGMPHAKRLTRLLPPQPERYRACTTLKVRYQEKLLALGPEIVGADPIACVLGLRVAPTLELILVDEMNRNGSGAILA